MTIEHGMGTGMRRRTVLAGLGAAAATAVTEATRASAAPVSVVTGRPAGDRAAVVRGTVLHYLADPGETPDSASWELFEDGALAVDSQGRVAWVGPASRLPDRLRQTGRHEDHRGRLIVPGFVDTHVHASQVDIIASYGEQLLQWLEKYTFPAEAKFADPAHAREVFGFFLDRLLAAGTTTASVFPTVHSVSVDAFFEQAAARNLRMLCGKVLMDREPYAPAFLRDASVEQAERATRELIKRWHGKGRLGYTLTPRFAPTSTEQLLTMVGRLLKEIPGLWLQTHLSENKDEVALVAELFGGRSYLDVYDRFGLVTDRSLFAHSIYIDDTDRQVLAAAGSSVAFCPTSNLFLGSGLFDLHAARARNVDVGMGTDIGAGTSYSMLQTLSEAYKVTALQGTRLPAHRGFYLATLGGAKALDLDSCIGNFTPGKEADFAVLDWSATPTLARRVKVAQTFDERLFALMTLGDERAVAATYILGRAAYRRRP
ncbi:guanine deaminase [Streptomyces sp. NPDC101151]|uniref:guanine deaminase n=1 Tax=Streptomyces sp. NPDC101151 TaxID=3366115 RepID=UPI0038263C83